MHHGNIDQNVDQQSIPNETSQNSAPQEQNTSKPADVKPGLDNMGNFKYLTAIYVVIMWCTYMMDGMSFFADMKGGDHPVINGLFVYIFLLGTLQYQQAFEDDSDTKNRIIQGFTLAVGYLWFCFIRGIWTMNN